MGLISSSHRDLGKEDDSASRYEPKFQSPHYTAALDDAVVRSHSVGDGDYLRSILSVRFSVTHGFVILSPDSLTSLMQ